MCRLCDIKNAAPIMIFGESEYERIINGIIRKDITTRSLDYKTYKATADKLTEAVLKGFGSEGGYGTGRESVLKGMKRNVFYFSGAKTYQQTREISTKLARMMAGKGETKTLSDFKAEAKKILTTYNENYLTAEYNFAMAQGLAADEWLNYTNDAELYPNLTYRTVGDGRVRTEHAALDGVTLPIGHHFWRKNFPPNDWNCRCNASQEGPDAKLTPVKEVPRIEIPKIFQMNAGRDRIVFSKHHPYFRVAKQDKEFAKRNFDLSV